MSCCIVTLSRIHDITVTKLCFAIDSIVYNTITSQEEAPKIDKDKNELFRREGCLEGSDKIEHKNNDR